MEPEKTVGHPQFDFSELRRRAETILRNKTKESEILQEDIYKLAHELSTYKIELDIQYEDLRNAQIELAKSHRRYTDLYDFAPVAYLTISEHGLILEANLTAADMLGVERSRLLNRRFSYFIDPDDQNKFYHRCKMLPNTGKQTFELRLHKKDGPPFYALMEAVANTDLDSPGQFRMSINDISGRKEAELAKLCQLKERYWAIVQDQTELICRLNSLGRITFVNDAYCRYFGIGHHEALGTNFVPNVYKEDLPLVRDYFQDLNKFNSGKTIEYRVESGDGTIRWQQWCGRALRDGLGKDIEYQVVGRDITQLKEAEEKIREESRMRQLFMDALPCIALLIEHHTHKIIAANKEATARGVLPGECCYFSYKKQDSPCHGCLAAKVLESGQIVSDRHWYNERYWDVHWVPIDERQYLRYAFDVTEKQKISEALERANEELEQRVQERTQALEESHAQLLHAEKHTAIGRLSASIAHEFSNPLHSVMIVLRGMEKYTSLEAKEKELVSLALKECLRMKDLLAGLRDFHRPTSGQKMQVEIHSILEELLTICKKDFRSRGITVHKKYADHLPVISIVVDQMKQVFLNLLNNAADACEGGGKISVVTERRGQDIVVCIEDSGSGISSADLPHIFEPFFSTKPESKGTGLGLSVSYGIVKRHGGRIDVESDPGKGSKFSVILPLEGTEADNQTESFCE